MIQQAIELLMMLRRSRSPYSIPHGQMNKLTTNKVINIFYFTGNDGEVIIKLRIVVSKFVCSV